VAAASDGNGSTKLLYERVCESYHGVDDFRMKLLGLLPVATGSAVFLLLSGDTVVKDDGGHRAAGALAAIGVFGFVFTCGLLAYELFGIKKCHYLLVAGTALERTLKAPGQFRSRPRELAGFINEPFASAIIYPASLAAWAFLALALVSELAAALVAAAVFAGGATATYFGIRRVQTNEEREGLVLATIGTGRERSLAREDAIRQWRAYRPRPDPVTRRLDALSARRNHLERAGPDAWVDVMLCRLEAQRAIECSRKDEADWVRPRLDGAWDKPALAPARQS
jgi:hypothetical protein